MTYLFRIPTVLTIFIFGLSVGVTQAKEFEVPHCYDSEKHAGYAVLIKVVFEENGVEKISYSTGSILAPGLAVLSKHALTHHYRENGFAVVTNTQNDIESIQFSISGTDQRAAILPESKKFYISDKQDIAFIQLDTSGIKPVNFPSGNDHNILTSTSIKNTWNLGYLPDESDPDQSVIHQVSFKGKILLADKDEAFSTAFAEEGMSGGPVVTCSENNGLLYLGLISGSGIVKPEMQIGVLEGVNRLSHSIPFSEIKRQLKVYQLSGFDKLSTDGTHQTVRAKVETFQATNKSAQEPKKSENPEAMFLKGVSYTRGEDGIRNDKEAAKWYQRAAELGHINAQYNLGVIYTNGLGVEKDTAKAFKWYEAAALQGVSDAQFNIALCYANGNGTIKDTAKAIKWYKHAALQGNGNAQYNLGHIYYVGSDVPKDLIEAKKWFQMAADKGDADAQRALQLLD